MISRILKKLRSTKIFKRYYFKTNFPKSHINLESSVFGPVLSNIVLGINTTIDKHSEVFTTEDGIIQFGNDCYIGLRTIISTSSRIEFGSHVSVQNNSTILGNVYIGSFCVLAPNLYVSSGRHKFKEEPEQLIRNQDLKYSNFIPSDRVIIEEDCWLGINVVVMPGVTIGKGAIIGSNSVVTKDILPYSICVGAPAKMIGSRLEFNPPDLINPLLSSSLPYLYRGFKLFLSDLNRGRELGGIFCVSSIILALNLDGKTNLVLEFAENFAPDEISYSSSKYYGANGKFKIDLKVNASNDFKVELELIGKSGEFLFISSRVD